MKKIFFTPLLAALALLMGGTGLQAQNSCDAYYPVRSGSVMELTHYNAKGKATAITHTEINEKSREGSRIIFEATATAMDEKRKELSKNAYTMSCDGGEFRMDMRGSMTQPQMEGVTMEIDADELVFPNTLTVGQELPEGSMTIKGSMNGMQIMNNTIRVYNRKVTGSESKTTPAGTFDCMVIEEDTDGSVMGMKFTTHSKTWISKGAGMVRSESYKNGKLESYSELTSLAK